jgi:YidC/Oxa1 family membrane protein insertase
MNILLPVWDWLIVQPVAQALRLLAVPFEAVLPPGAAGALAIILFAVLVHLLLLPLSMAQIRSWRVRRALQPELKVLQRKFHGDGEGLARAQAALFRQRGVNPAAGYLPLLLHWPILVGVYAAILQLAAGDPRFSSPVLWLSSLSGPDRVQVLGSSLPGPLLALMTFAAFLAQRTSAMPASDPPQRLLVGAAAFLPLVYLAVLLNAPAGLVLYWFISQLLLSVQQLVSAGRPPNGLAVARFDRRGPEPPDGAGRGARLPWRPVAPSDHAAAVPDEPLFQATDAPIARFLRRRAGRLE